jgi:hypothetical protein
LLTSGYFGVLVLFVGMVAFCFIWGVWEFKKPKDPGPLFVDLDRAIKKRMKKHEPSMSRAPSCDHSSQSRMGSTLADSSELAPISSVNETIRVRGDLRIAKGEVIPYNMIVEGNLISQEDVTFKGGLHVKGRVVIGARNRLEKSIVCQEELILFEGVIVYNCIDCEGIVFIKNGVRVGVGVEGGGIASASTIYLENAKGPLRVHSKERICIVGALEDVIPDELRQIIEVKTT